MIAPFLNNYLGCQMRAIRAHATRSLSNDDLLALLEELNATRTAIENELQWRKIHKDGAA
ncbi:hypothetical protein IVB45_18560 [Bradyrhizobium sp. 4]|uniref:hypothetical protein n=1 Tax=unclassified Bradyrhizobium TaxID=2631580 RepID=UPI001FFAC960|nr:MULTISPECIES: hypothetical protein [unclassified Bradyrhizobium]MCK1400124.1 hypothetical protein [Bradyrhizobium sp. 39]MCK1750414.1 hypothetical protein [Bradyrhizobium sp. 135]UPJ32023.1 hypothetical protein IVB45_18560 [Bradyrhizobium sp. 4]